MNPNPFDHDYHTYGSPTVLSDQQTTNHSRPISMTNTQQGGGKPRPFVQAYDPTEEQPHYAGYDGSQSPSTNYQQSYSQYDNNAYPHDTYYAPQHEPMISNYNLYEYGRNVPDQNDYNNNTARRESRHVPNERPSVPHTK